MGSDAKCFSLPQLPYRIGTLHCRIGHASGKNPPTQSVDSARKDFEGKRMGTVPPPQPFAVTTGGSQAKPEMEKKVEAGKS